MRKYLTILFLFVSLIASGTDYYVKNGGSDAADGLTDGTAWETIDKVNTVWAAGAFAPGDNIYFKRGGIFYGTITPMESGTAGNVITVGAYSTGNDPIITGFQTASSWTAYDANIDYCTIATVSDPTFITIDSVWKAMGREPDGVFSTYESHSGTASITDNQLTEPPDWTGAEAVIIPYDWMCSRYNITNHVSTTLSVTTLGDSYEFTNGYGYFIQNDLRTLDTFGEWYYDGTDLYVYSGTNTITDYKIRVPSIDNLFYNGSTYYDYITLTDLQFIGSGSDAVKFESSSNNITVENCTFDFSGRDAIRISSSGANKYAIINNNNFNHSIGSAIYSNCYLTDTYNEFTNNTISNAGTLLGANFAGSKNMGIYCNRDNYVTIQYNTIDSCGYVGIYFGGHYSEVKNNLIQYACALLTDGGGIYTNARVVGDTIRGRVIESNIILNTIRNNEGKNSTHRRVYDIYLDNPHAYVNVLNNVTAYSEGSGYHFAGAFKDTISGNISFDQYEGVHWQDATVTSQKNSVTNNQFVALSLTQYTAYAYIITRPWMTATGNYYAKPLDVDGNHFYLSGTGATNLAAWKVYSVSDADAQDSPEEFTLESEVYFYYNATSTANNQSLPIPMITLAGTAYNYYYTIPAWGGVVLLKNTSYVPPAPSSYGFGINSDSTKFLKNSNGQFIILPK